MWCLPNTINFCGVYLCIWSEVCCWFTQQPPRSSQKNIIASFAYSARRPSGTPHQLRGHYTRSSSRDVKEKLRFLCASVRNSSLRQKHLYSIPGRHTANRKHIRRSGTNKLAGKMSHSAIFQYPINNSRVYRRNRLCVTGDYKVFGAHQILMGKLQVTTRRYNGRRTFNLVVSRCMFDKKYIYINYCFNLSYTNQFERLCIKHTLSSLLNENDKCGVTQCCAHFSVDVRIKYAVFHMRNKIRNEVSRAQCGLFRIAYTLSLAPSILLQSRTRGIFHEPTYEMA